MNQNLDVTLITNLEELKPGNLYRVFCDHIINGNIMQVGMNIMFWFSLSEDDFDDGIQYLSGLCIMFLELVQENIVKCLYKNKIGYLYAMKKNSKSGYKLSFMEIG